MAIIKRLRKRTQQIPNNSPSLVSTGRSQAEEGGEVNSNTSGNNQTPPLLCEACGERFQLREELFNHMKTHTNIRQPHSVVNSSIGESPTEPLIVSKPEPKPESETPGPNGLITRQLLTELMSGEPESNDGESSRNNRRKRMKNPTPDLTLRVGLKRRRGRPRTRPLPPDPSCGPSRQYLLSQEFATSMQLARGNVGSVDRMASLFQALSDEELELKLGL